MRILVVEDEAVIGLLIVELLAGEGHDILGPFASGEQALLAAAEALPDLAVMDITLSGPLDGIEVARELRRRHGVRVIYVTSHTDPATRGRAAATEPFAYLVKPFDPAALERAVARVADHG